MEFIAFPKMARLSRECVITEKIDGTNAQIYIVDTTVEPITAAPISPIMVDHFALFPGSRTRLITPGKSDNAGFAGWVRDNAAELAKLGPGRHYGEWWGKGIQRGYGLEEKRFSLFNTSVWADRHMGELTYTGDGSVGPIPAEGQRFAPACCRVVPVLYRGEFNTHNVDQVLEALATYGSSAAPGFMRPEGIVVFHTAAGIAFKKTIENDEVPKSQAERRAA